MPTTTRANRDSFERIPNSALAYLSPVLAGVAYPFWHLLAPEPARDPWFVWWAIGAYMIALGIGGARIARVRRHASAFYYAIMWLVVGQFFVLASINDMHPFYAVGSVIGVLASASAVGNRRAFLAFSVYVVSLGVGLFAVSPDLRKVVYWAPCAILLRSSYERLRRLLEAEEEVERSRQELEHRVEERTRELTQRSQELSRANEKLESAMEQRSRLEDRLALSQKLEALGRLAGGVAHEFNNVLTAINGYAELIRRRVPGESPLREDAEQIARCVDRAAAITRQLVSFSRRGPGQTASVDVNRVLVDAYPMLRVLMGEEIETRLVLGSGSARIWTSRDQLDQVVLNLAVNARDAMPRGGSFVIETATARRGDLAQEIPAELAGDEFLLLRFSDTGHGMDRETAGRVFDPFFTTKDVDQGRGLGLSIVYGIVQRGEGHVRVVSHPGRGTRFEIYWPSAEEPVEEEADAVARAPAERGHERILLVEDEDDVRHLVQRVLEGDGYAVLAARDAESALRLAEEAKGPIDLLLTDIVMPRMNGIQLARRMADRRPGLKVLFISGHADHPTLRDQALPAGSTLIAKPFPPAELSCRVRDCLDHRPGPAP